jgi:uncharacterized membrane protein YgaE (UPF0421/DUF939 family)
VFAQRDAVAELRLAIKMTLGGTLAWWIASALGAQLPIFAALVPLVATVGDPFATVAVSISRIVGVFAGVGLGIAVIHLDVPTTAQVAIVLGAGTLAGVLLQFDGRVNLEIPIAALFIIAFSRGNVEQVGVQRIWETAIGAVVTILVATLLWPPDPIRALDRRLERLRQQLAADFAAVADDLATGSGATAGQLEDLREHSRDAVRDVFALDSARRALRWNPLRRKDVGKLRDYEHRIRLASRAARHVRAVGRDVTDAPVRDPMLAAATRDLADAADRSLRNQDPREPLARADRELDRAREPIVAAQLRQLWVDLGG